jgi:hypothetical protein
MDSYLEQANPKAAKTTPYEDHLGHQSAGSGRLTAKKKKFQSTFVLHEHNTK